MRSLCLLSLASLAICLPGMSCSSGPPGIGFTKVKYYHLKEKQDADERRRRSDGPSMIRFERQFYLRGAVTEEDKAARFGNYYTFFWRGEPGSEPVILRFEYRQAKSGERIHRVEQTIATVRERNVSRFRITGEAYAANGPVISWRASLLEGERLLDVERSFLWKDALTR